MKLTWKKISKLVSEESEIDPQIVEKVLRGFKVVTDGERDPDCELLNAFHDLSE